MYNSNKNWAEKLLLEKLIPLEPQCFDSGNTENTNEPMRDDSIYSTMPR